MANRQRSQWSDNPKLQTDIGGRSEFAAAVAAKVDQTGKDTSSTVYGLIGPWGSGKTTLLNDIEERLRWKTVWFSPWSASDVSAITTEFVVTLATAFSEKGDLKRKLLHYARFGLPALKLVPYLGDAAAEVSGNLLDQLSIQPAWHEEFEVISKEIGAQGERVLVIVDDVDRLDAIELRALLRVIRLLGRFDNVHYLLAYDQETIEQLLTGSSIAGHRSDFMEKIVQHPFEVPPAPAIVRRRWARSIISIVVPEADQLSGPMRSATDELVSILADGIETPRAARRLEEQVKSFKSLAVNAELDGLDFVVISWLRIAHHKVWNHIRTRSSSYQGWSRDDVEQLQGVREQGVEERVDRGAAKVVWSGVRFLFEEPRQTNDLSVRSGRMREDRYYDRYFLLSLAEDDISDASTILAVTHIIENRITTQTATFTEVLLGEDGELAALAVRVARSSRHDTEPSMELVNFLRVIREKLEGRQSQQDFRLPPLESWLEHEVILALDGEVLSGYDAVQMFGYDQLATFALNYRWLEDDEEKRLILAFTRIVREWIEEVRSEKVEVIIIRPEFVRMIVICRRFGLEIGAGLLEPGVSSVDDLIAIAEKFVGYNRWSGASIHFSLKFYEDEFRFATGGAFTESCQAALPASDDTLNYEISERDSPILAPAELRDFAIGKLRALKINKQTVPTS
ncbi:hypothetical protein GRS96_17655 [Rathayibacter sp. VKM Ac-2803]|uniref:KAP family P-loop NTPase fold protein n=1 Tax=Rathayibacter sp. VKM Ac-2803 TaxID=2609256 RepID=UPI0013586B21|nr:P-loop NTPase fold protein [Rathayibacter sp. VKM Ac-2803]MWV51099.1 hypothetical protein [Rathayibacter sp. VKM Ac-2803]